ncbi:MAG: amidohydrolase family protein [Chloroflexota bacterium]|nr:amidohydrolase family protein [Chloroflexota bacterium]
MGVTLIHGARVFDGTGAPPADGNVLIEGDRITAVAPGIAAPDGAEIVEARGKFLMPGMIDAHVHATLFGEEGLQTYARLGVTTVKDLGGVFEQALSLRERSRDGQVPGARVLAVGAFVEGDPPAWGAVAQALFPGMEVHRDEADIERTVARNLDAGVDGIKLYAGLPPRLVRHAIETIARRVPVTGHLTATTAEEAIDAGIDGLEHLQLSLYRDLVPHEHELAAGDTMGNLPYWGKVRRGWEAIDPSGEAVTRIAGAMAARAVRLIPTLVLGARVDTEFTTEEEAAFTEAQRPRLAMRPAGARPSAADLERSAENMIRVIERMHLVGVRVLPGTDCGAVGVPPGYGYHMELALMAKAMPNTTVLAAATSGAAAWLRRDDLGVIAPGKRADLLLIDGEPLRDIADTRRIASVWMDGLRVDHDANARRPA